MRIDNKMASAASGSISNTSNAITFPAASGGDHGTIVAIAIFDSDVGGSNNMLAYGSLTASKTISDGDQLNIAAGNLTISID